MRGIVTFEEPTNLILVTGALNFWPGLFDMGTNGFMLKASLRDWVTVPVPK